MGFRRDKTCSSPLTGEASSSNEGAVGASSRPHSSTSAELEAGMSAMSVQPQPVQQNVSMRSKENKYDFACLFILIKIILTLTERNYSTMCSNLHNSVLIIS